MELVPILGVAEVTSAILLELLGQDISQEIMLHLTSISDCAYTKPVEIRFSRHARNKMRLYKLTPEEIEEAINSGEKLSRGDKWESQCGGLRVIWLMVGSYALVVTVIKTRQR